MSKRELIKRIADHLLLLGFGLLLTWIVIALIIFGKVTIVEDIFIIKLVDLICVIGITGYAIYRIATLFKEVRKESK